MCYQNAGSIFRTVSIDKDKPHKINLYSSPKPGLNQLRGVNIIGNLLRQHIYHDVSDRTQAQQTESTYKHWIVDDQVPETEKH